MKKHISLWMVILCASFSINAEEADVMKYVNAKKTMLNTQIQQLQSSIAFLSSGNIYSDKEIFDRVGEQGFTAVEDALLSNGYTVITFFQYQAENEQEIDTWLASNTQENSDLVILETEFNQLVDQYEQLIKSTANGL